MNAETALWKLTHYQRFPAAYTLEERREIFRAYNLHFPTTTTSSTPPKTIQVAKKRIRQTNIAKRRKVKA